MSMCKDCISGVIHEGTPTGTLEKIGGIDCYTATPEGDYDKELVVLYIMDAFGITLNNNQLLVDDYARNGYKTVALDFLNGDPLPEDALTQPNFDFMDWMTRHGPEQTRPPIDTVVSALRAQGVKVFAGVGYCFGARYLFDLAFDGVLKVGAISHPSLLTYPVDFEMYVKKATAPLLINSCEFDQMFPKEVHAEVDTLFANFAPGYKREYYEGCTHGFSVRGDMSDPKVKEGKENAFCANITWLKEHL